MIIALLSITFSETVTIYVAYNMVFLDGKTYLTPQLTSWFSFQVILKYIRK